MCLPDDRIVFTAPEVATLLKVGKNRVYEMVQTGELRAIRIGRSVRIPRAELDRLLASASGNDQAPHMGLAPSLRDVVRKTDPAAC